MRWPPHAAPARPPRAGMVWRMSPCPSIAVPAAQVRRPCAQCARPRFHGGRARHHHPVRRATAASGRDPGGRPEDLHSRRSGALDASPELAKIAERLAAPVAKALLGKAALADRGRAARDGSLRGSAAVLRYCSSSAAAFPTSSARGVQIDKELRYPFECGLVGEAAPTLRAWLALLRRTRTRAFSKRRRRECANGGRA
jgi:hypothetical protein